jgi:hypothetical protein
MLIPRTQTGKKYLALHPTTLSPSLMLVVYILHDSAKCIKNCVVKKRTDGSDIFVALPWYRGILFPERYIPRAVKINL